MKTELKNLSHNSHTIALSKGTIFAKNVNADISKIKEVLVLKVSFLKLHTEVYLCTKFQVSSITLTGFKQGVIYPSHHTATTTTTKQTPKKPSQIRFKYWLGPIKYCFN